jgi:hypothetical protein
MRQRIEADLHQRQHTSPMTANGRNINDRPGGEQRAAFGVGLPPVAVTTNPWPCRQIERSVIARLAMRMPTLSPKSKDMA